MTAQVSRWLIKACMAAFAGLVVWSCRTPIRERQGWRLGAEFSLVVLGMLLFSERTWKHHCVTLVLPFAVLCYQLATADLGRWMRGYLIGSLGVAGLLMTLPSLSGISEVLAKQSEIYGVYVVAYVVLLAALAVILRRARSAERAAIGARPTEETIEPLAASRSRRFIVSGPLKCVGQLGNKRPAQGVALVRPIHRDYDGGRSGVIQNKLTHVCYLFSLRSGWKA